MISQAALYHLWTEDLNTVQKDHIATEYTMPRPGTVQAARVTARARGAIFAGRRGAFGKQRTGWWMIADLPVNDREVIPQLCSAMIARG